MVLVECCFWNAISASPWAKVDSWISRSAPRASSTRIGYPLAVHRVRDAAEQGTLLFEDDDFTVRCTPLTHRVPAYAYRIEQKPLAGRFDIEKARELNIPPGPVYAQLKRGETVTLEDGRSIDGTSLCGEERPGVSVVYCTDTVFCEACLLYTSPSPRDKRQSRMPSSA